MSLRVVVFPEPLRPSNINVSPRCTRRLRFASSTRPSPVRWVTFTNSIAALLSCSAMGEPIVTSGRPLGVARVLGITCLAVAIHWHSRAMDQPGVIGAQEQNHACNLFCLGPLAEICVRHGL